MKQRIISSLKWSEKYTKIDMTYLASGFFWGNINYVFFSVLGFVVSILFARYLTKETYGIYQYILSIASLIGATTLTGMNSAVTRAIAQGNEGDLKSSTRYQIVFGIIPMVISFGISFWYLIHGRSDFALAFLWIPLFLPLGNAFNTWAAYLGGRKLFQSGTYFGLLNSLISYTGIITLVYFTRDFVWITFATFFFGFLGNIVLYHLVTRRIPPNDKTNPDTIPYGKHLSLMAIPGIVSAQLDAFLIFQFIGPAGLAIYSFATIIPEKLAGALKTISNIALPKFSMKSESGVSDFVFKKIWWILLFVLLSAGIYVLFVPWLFNTFFPAYSDSILFSQVYALSFFSVVATFLQSALTSQQRTKELYIVSFTIPSIKIVLLVTLMYYFKVWGVIWAQIITNFISISLQMYLLKHKKLEGITKTV